MLSKLSHTIAAAVRSMLAHPQLLVSVLLVLLIPVIFLYTGQQFLKVSSENQSRLEKDKIGVMHDMFAEVLKAQHENPTALQAHITKFTELNPDLTKFRVVERRDNGLWILADIDSSVVGTSEDEADFYRFSELESRESLIYEYYINQERYWQAFRAVHITNDKTLYIFTETSFANTDALFKDRITKSYVLLFVLLGIVLYLAYRQLRQIDYGYLYNETKSLIATRDLFTNMVTHEMRAPLTAIRGYASMIHEDNGVPFTTREQALRIEQSSARLLTIVNDLLEVARLQSGKLTIEKAEVNLCEVITSVLYALESTAREKKLTLTHDYKRSHCTFLSDEKRLHQIFTNLVNNAIKYTEEGTITVVVDETDKEIKVRVQDTGMGIDAESQKKLFAPFFRVESKDVSDITGSGLGMWITKELVALLNGTIAVESIEGIGTHVVVTFTR
jgi:signal transduction histidine kinase